MRPNRSTRCLDGRLGVGGVGDVELDGQQVVVLAEGRGDGVGVAGGGDHRMAGGQCGLGDVDAHATAGAGDEPNLLVSHAGCTSFWLMCLWAPRHRRCTVHQTSQRGEVADPVRGVLAGTPSRAGALVAWKTWQATSDPGGVRGEIREFLGTRRARISPEQAGLPVYGGERRRVPGLRREEVAVLAGISIEYYTRLERGNATGVSESVIDGIGHALQLDEAERAHLLDLIRTAGPTRPPRRRPPAASPARSAANHRLDDRHARVRAQRTPGHPDRQRPRVRAVLADLRRPGQAPQHRPVRLPRPAATEFFRDWDKVANDTVALLRAEAGRDPYDRGLSDLIGELSTRSDEFRVRWAAHNVQIHTTGVKLIHHPVVGDLELPFESFPIPAEPSQSLLTYTAEPGSPSQDALNLLASWAARPAHDSQASPHDNDEQSTRQDRGDDRPGGSASGPAKPERS